MRAEGGGEKGGSWGRVRTEAIWAHWALVCTSMQQPHIPLRPHSRITRQADSPWLLGKKQTLGLLQGLHFQPYKDRQGRGEGDRQGHGDGDIIQGHGEGDRQRRKEVYPALIPSGWEALQGNSAGQSNSSMWPRMVPGALWGLGLTQSNWEEETGNTAWVLWYLQPVRL